MTTVYGASTATATGRNYLDVPLLLHTVRVDSWRAFFAEVTGTPAVIDEATLQTNTTRLEDAGFHSTENSFTEPMLQGMLPVLLPVVNYIVEDTHATVRNFSEIEIDRSEEIFKETE